MHCAKAGRIFDVVTHYTPVVGEPSSIMYLRHGAINGSPEEAIYYYKEAREFDSKVTEEAPEKLLQAAKLIGEGNKKMANGDAQGAKASYRAAKEQAQKHLAFFDPETGNTKQGPEQHVTTNTLPNH